MRKLQQISDSELEIMHVIWHNDNSALFTHIMSALDGQSKSWKTNTVLTFLARLTEKGFVSTKKHGRLNEYVAVVSYNEYIDEQTKTFVHKIFGGNAKSLVSSLLKQDYINSDDMDELREFWEGGTGKDE